ncbi:hypothetical protein WOLCODRAFT_14596 [Wolfiporia cocos MD-104 SS10]|uniref:Uncharacterized protein n=1 Tax=Wolfiporia cocos (strain MD-104) TaxID=742152 RepID=A0A2H3J3D6_WOLCO|nr:hypothetical protein WOLCODRAFT_14596 [Wolfiporia cocos MD-104 SS10]
MLFLVPVICFSFLRPVLAALRNVTIDDTYGDPDTGVQFTYAPAGNWSLGQNCTNCEAHPDPAYTYDKSWHDTTFFPSLDTAPPNASVSFNGSAIYVYCIVYHTTSYPNNYMDLRFLIDGEETGNFNQIPTGSTEIDYNHLVYKNSSIPHGVHTFTLVNGQPGGQAALVLLDYMTYT